MATGYGLGFGEDVRQEIMGRLRLGYVHPDFHDHDVFAVSGNHVVHVGQALGIEGRPCGGIRIERHAADIPSRAVGLQSVENPPE
jgi:hypothetical protein